MRTPQIRFSDYQDEWHTVRFDRIGNFFKGSGLSKADLSTFGTPCVLYGELYTTYESVIRTVVSKTNSTSKGVQGFENDILIPASGESALDIACAATLEVDNVLIGGDLNIIRPSKEYDGRFIAYQLNVARKKDLAKLAQGASVVHLYNNSLKKVELNIPSKNEQQKIADFLSLLDRRIEEQQKKVKALREQKKGLLQKLFRREIRFKDEQGNDFPDWKPQKLTKILKERKLYAQKGKEYPHASLSKEGISLKTDRYNRDFLVTSVDKKYKITKLDDICYNPANLKFGVICRNKMGSAIFSPIYVTFEVQSGFDSNFMEYYLCRNDFIQKVRKYEEGTVYERMAVKPEDFLKYKDEFPNIEEQKKIGQFFIKFDLKIVNEEKRIEELRKQKQGYLQQMFI
ncbi:restriction endonuclease subunit S [Aquibacillus sp. 3ASR75-11]|uniref:Restriction endonuclease subunit S n=1 Tax=Terrihalobacillus insolitus TaxID=2950438 RepID=A0A9X3WTH3_9BACI|nr:restriction endonuclease subunit S [Terrihalobacillus insolitus]MDC3424558.1 restriction endonuclease subunit S [Terrihalobacillus insolitus]